MEDGCPTHALPLPFGSACRFMRVVLFSFDLLGRRAIRKHYEAKGWRRRGAGWRGNGGGCVFLFFLLICMHLCNALQVTNCVYGVIHPFSLHSRTSFTQSMYYGMYTPLHTLSFALVSHPLQHNPTLLILHHANKRQQTANHNPLHTRKSRGKQTRVTSSKFRRAEPIPQTRRVRKVLSRYLDSLENGKS